MKVSVVIPAYNEEDYLGIVLKSLQSQTVRPNEIIVVDNNSTDKTSQIARKYGARVITEKKQGMIFARNAGFDAAKYKLTARCDADVILPPNWIEIIIRNFQTKDIDALSGPVIFYDSYLKHASTVPSRLYLRLLGFLSGGQKYLVGPNMIITKKIWLKCKSHTSINDKEVHEDLDLTLNILKQGGKIGYDNTLIIQTSSRRMANQPGSFFLEYPLRLIKTFWINRS